MMFDAVLPRSAPRNPCGPRVVMTTTSAAPPAAASTIVSTTVPATDRRFHLQRSRREQPSEAACRIGRRLRAGLLCDRHQHATKPDGAVAEAEEALGGRRDEQRWRRREAHDRLGDGRMRPLCQPAARSHRSWRSGCCRSNLGLVKITTMTTVMVAARSRALWTAAVLLPVFAMYALSAQAQQPRDALTLEEVTTLLTSGVPMAAIQDGIEERGVDFRLTVTIEANLQAAGATEAFLQALRALSALITVTSEPSGAAVSIDGRERGETPLELRLQPGTVRVTLTLDGFLVVPVKQIATYRVSVERG